MRPTLLLLFAAVASAQSRAGIVIVDDSEFYEHMPKGTIIARGGGQSRSGPALPVDSWLFDNSALVMRSQAYMYAKAEIPEAGTYHLFVRSHGDEKSSFRIIIGDRQTSERFGNSALSLRRGGAFDLARGPVDIVLSRVGLGGSAGPLFDALFLSRNPSLTEADLRALELPEDVELLKEYEIPRSSAIKFGDVDGDGKSDFFVLEGDYSGHMFDHSGRKLWSYENQATDARKRAEFEAPGLVWDFDRNGRAEAVHYQLEQGREWLVMRDGLSGGVLHRTEWPATRMPHEYYNLRLAVARFSSSYPSHLIVFSDSGGSISITAFTRELKQVWQHVEMKSKDHLGHYAYAFDLDGDTTDEIVASGIVLDATGKVRWNRFDLLDDNRDHADSFRFHDLDGDGRMEMLAPASELGVLVFDSKDGRLRWKHPAEHAQQLEVGNFLRGTPGPHVAVNARTYARNGEAGLGGQVHWFDASGNLLRKWPANPLNGNPEFVKGDWRGTGVEELFWYKFRMTEEGRGVLSFKHDVYHMFDFIGAGNDQVIARGGNRLLVYGYRGAKRRSVTRDLSYLKRVANHTHY
jgi:hypothetical protein